MQNHTNKFYRKNEADIMRLFNLEPTLNSGSGWVQKEDGENEAFLCQLKSTDKDSISIKIKDIETLELNAGISHKIPVFMVQFIKTGRVLLLLSPEDIQAAADYLCTGVKAEIPDMLGTMDIIKQERPRRIISSCGEARKQIEREHEEKYKKKDKDAY